MMKKKHKMWSERRLGVFCSSFFVPSNPQSLIPNPYLTVVMVFLAGILGCQQNMADQPSYKPLEKCDFFPDGRSERPAIPGTVARGHLQTDVALWTGRRVGKSGKPLGLATPTVVQPPPDSPEEAKARKEQYEDFVDTFPFPITEAVLQHGFERYMIYCVVCHDALGTGDGKIVERGYTAPPSYHSQRCATCRPATCSRSSARDMDPCRPTLLRFPLATAGQLSATCGHSRPASIFRKPSPLSLWERGKG